MCISDQSEAGGHGASSFKMLLQRFRDLMQRGTHGRDLADGVQQAVVVNEVLVAHHRDVYAGGVEIAGVCKALIAQDVVSSYLDKRGRKALELLGRRLQRRGVDLRRCAAFGA